MARPRVCGRGRTWWESDGKVSIERNCVSLLMSKNLKLQKVIKVSYLNQFRVFRDSLRLFHIFISWLYIFRPGYVTHLKPCNCGQKQLGIVLECYLQNVFTHAHTHTHTHIYKHDVALHDQQCLICHKSQPNQIIYI